MAEKRMFAKSIVLSDAFLDMPMSARCLYFTLSMCADDDGFVGSPKAIMRQCGTSQDDIALLLQKRYVLGFESGVIVIKHWRINNYLQNDRHKDTTYIEELKMLSLDAKGAYVERVEEPCIQNVYNLDTKCIHSIDKNSIDKDSIDTIAPSAPAKQKKEKHRHGKFQHVLLTDDEYVRLESDYRNIEELIGFLDEYIEEKGYKSQSHNIAIRRWVADAVNEQHQRKAKNKGKNPAKENSSVTSADIKAYEEWGKKRLKEQEGSQDTG